MNQASPIKEATSERTVPKSVLINLTDELLIEISQARAILELLTDNGSEDQFTVDHATVLNALWCVDDQLARAELTLKGN